MYVIEMRRRDEVCADVSDRNPILRKKRVRLA